MTAVARKLLLVFALLGLGASGAATYVHYNLIQNPDYSSFCDINATVSCKQAYLSQYGSVAGVPVAVGGIIFFAWVLLMVWGSRGKSAIKDSAPAYIFAGSTLGLAVVLYLAYASFFILKEVCPLCVATYVAVIGVFIISGGASSVPMSSLPKRAWRDMRLLVATPLAIVIALLFVGGTAWGVSAFPREAERPVTVQIPPVTEAQRAELEQWWNVQPVVSNFPIANNGAKVLIVEFADFQCGACKTQYLNTQPILDKYKSRPTDVRFELHHWPISSLCNPKVPSAVHPAACDAAAAYEMAKAKGTSDTLKDWFFVNQERLSPATVRSAAADVGKITDFDAQFAKAIQQVRTDVSIGSAVGVASTPSFFINGRRIPGGGVAAQYFEALIELELKRATK
jgi:uncharacterized membrane protein/protein-disulfide isomerase